MEIMRAESKVQTGELRSAAAGFLLKLSGLCLGATIILIPMRYQWIAQARFIPPVYPEYTHRLVYLTDISLFLTLSLWLASLIVQPRRVSLQPTLLTAGLAGLVLAAGGSALFSVDRVLSLVYAGRLLLLFEFYLYLTNTLHSLAPLVIPAGLQALFQGVVGITQVLRQHSLGLAALRELELDPAWKGVSIVEAAGIRSLRAYGLTDHPNLLGGCLAFAMLLLAAGYLEAPPERRPWLAGLFGVGGLALLLTFSRAAWAGLLAGLVWIALWVVIRRRWVGFRLWLGLCGGTFLLLLPFLWSNAAFLSSRLHLDGSYTQATPENQSIHERSILVGQALAMIRQHPLTGVGVGTYPIALHQAVPDYPFDYQPPHLVGLEIAAETGLAGALIYLLVLLTPGFLFFKEWRRLSLSLPLVGASAALLAISVVSFLDYYPWLLNPGRLWQWLLWGAWGGIYAGMRRESGNG